MDFFLFVLLLVGFAALYIAFQVYFLWTLIILIMICLFYIVIRFPRGKEDWPWGFTDNLYLIGMTDVIIIVFSIVVPDMPLIGSQLQYPSPAPPEGWEIRFSMRDPFVVLTFFVIQALMWLFVFAILIPYLQRQISEAGGGGKGSEWEGDKGGGKPKIGVGA